MSAIAGLSPHPIVDLRISDWAEGDDTAPVVARAADGVEWDRVVSGFDQICQEQLFGFASLRWPGVTLEPRLFEQSGRVVGGALMMIQPLPLGIAKIAIVKWGPMLARSGAAQAPRLHDRMIDAMIAEYADQRGMMISIMPRASTEAINAEYLVLRERGFRRGAPLPYPDRYLVRVRLGDEDQRKSFDQTWRRQLNKAEKAGLSFEHAGAERLGEFKALYSAMTERKQFPDHSAYQTLDSLMAMDEPLRPELFFVRHEGELVAGALVFKAGERAAYLYGATNSRALPLRAGYFLQWQILRWLRENSAAQWYDLGGTDGYCGLHQFKKGMVGQAGVIRPIPPVLNYASRPLARLLGTAALNAREALVGLSRRIEARRPSGARPDMAPHQLEDYLS